MMGFGKQEGDSLVLGLAHPSCPHVQMEKEVLEQLGASHPQSSSSLASTAIPCPELKTKMDFLLLFFSSSSYPPSTHSEEGSEVGERIGAAGGLGEGLTFQNSKKSNT